MVTWLRARVQSRRSKSLLSLYDAAKQFTKNQRMLVKAKYVCEEKKICASLLPKIHRA